MWRNEILLATRRARLSSQLAVDKARDLEPIAPTREGDAFNHLVRHHITVHYFHNLSYLGSFPLLPARRRPELHGAGSRAPREKRSVPAGGGISTYRH